MSRPEPLAAPAIARVAVTAGAQAGRRGRGLLSDTPRPRGASAAPARGEAPELSLVIPAWREAHRLGPTLERVAAHLSGLPLAAEVLVVDDGSDDGTGRVALEHAPRFESLRLLRHERRRGKGAAVRTGFAAARGRWVLFLDADLSTPIEELGGLLAALEAGADVALGSRRARGAQVLRPQPLRRRLAGAVLRAVAAALLPGLASDPTCGFKAFRRAAARRLAAAGTVDGFAFDLEWLVLARRLGLRVVECPIRWRDDRRSSVRFLQDAPGVLLDLWRIRRRATPGGLPESRPRPRSA